MGRLLAGAADLGGVGGGVCRISAAAILPARGEVARPCATEGRFSRALRPLLPGRSSTSAEERWSPSPQAGRTSLRPIVALDMACEVGLVEIDRLELFAGE